MSTYTDLKPFRFWCQKVLPLVYDDSLSYYELLCKVVDYLNTTMENVDYLHDEVTDMYEAWDAYKEEMLGEYTQLVHVVNTLESYVNYTYETLTNEFERLGSYVENYFENLDVQEEIDNKLDEMAQNGTLTALLQAAFEDEFHEYVDAALDEELRTINSSISELQTDVNTIEGQIDNLTAQTTTNLSGWEITDWTINAPVQNMAATATFNDVPHDAIILEAVWQDYAGATGDSWFQHDVIVDRVAGTTTDTIQVAVNNLTTQSANINIKLTIATEQSVAIPELTDIRTGADGKTYSTAGDAVRGQIELVEDKILDPYNVGINTKFTDNRRIAYNTGNQESNNDWAATDYIDITGITNMIYTKIYINTTQTITTGMAFYDVDKQYLSGVVAGRRTGGGMGYEILTVPANAVYARFTYYKTTSANHYTRPFKVYDFDKYAAFILNNSSSRVSASVIPGTVLTTSGADAFSYSTFYNYRKLSKLIKVGTAPVLIQVPDASAFSSMGILKYKKVNGAITFSEYVGLNQFIGNNFLFMRSTWDDCEYIRITLTPVVQDGRKYPDVSFVSVDQLTVTKNPNIANPTYGHVTFAYETSNGAYTSGQLRLPPNYTEDGNPVPLYVNVHGTGAYDTWTRKMGTSEDTDSYYLLEYMANEGFAVFDCYPWTSKYYSANSQISPIATPTHEFAYIDGIKFICENYNVDINNVCMMFKSLGGHLGYWSMCQSYIKPKALAMLAPSTGFASTIWARFFVQQNLRSNVITLLGLSGESGASRFISTDRGMEDTTVMEFVEEHIDDFFRFNPAIYGVNGATYKDQYDWMLTGETSEPQWMIDLGIPAWSIAWQSGHGIGVPSIVNHPDLSKHSMYPVKFWQAFDDVNTSAHANYTIYNWLKNGGSDVAWRTLPNGTGGHHAIDTDPDALKSSGTTRLGIAYQDIPTTYVEMADFFYDKMN